jgi:hypothetical protein
MWEKSMSIRTVLTAMTKGVGALGLGCTALGYVAEQAGPRECRAVIHVTEADVDVWVDGLSYRVDSWRDSPILCPLRPGHHALRMCRGGQTLYEETFTLRRGDDVVLTAWDQARPRPTDRCGDPAPASPP